MLVGKKLVKDTFNNFSFIFMILNFDFMYFVNQTDQNKNIQFKFYSNR